VLVCTHCDNVPMLPDVYDKVVLMLDKFVVDADAASCVFRSVHDLHSNHTALGQDHCIVSSICSSSHLTDCVD